MSLLSICQSVARRLGIAVPASIVSNTGNRDAMLLWELANVEGYQLSKRVPWNQLLKETSFTTVADEFQYGSLPTDFEAMIQDTMFNRTTRRRVAGPLDAQAWQLYKATLIVPTDPVFMLRSDGDQTEIMLAPTPAAGEEIYYEYVSKNWARSSTGGQQDSFEADTDTTVFPEEIVKQGVLWRFKAHKGLEHETDRFDYERMVVDQILRNGSKPVLQLAETTTAKPGRGQAFIQDYNTIQG